MRAWWRAARQQPGGSGRPDCGLVSGCGRSRGGLVSVACPRPGGSAGGRPWQQATCRTCQPTCRSRGGHHPRACSRKYSSATSSSCCRSPSPRTGGRRCRLWQALTGWTCQTCWTCQPTRPRPGCDLVSGLASGCDRNRGGPPRAPRASSLAPPPRHLHSTSAPRRGRASPHLRAKAARRWSHRPPSPPPPEARRGRAGRACSSAWLGLGFRVRVRVRG